MLPLLSFRVSANPYLSSVLADLVWFFCLFSVRPSHVSFTRHHPRPGECCQLSYANYLHFAFSAMARRSSGMPTAVTGSVVSTVPDSQDSASVSESLTQNRVRAISPFPEPRSSDSGPRRTNDAQQGSAPSEGSGRQVPMTRASSTSSLIAVVRQQGGAAHGGSARRERAAAMSRHGRASSASIQSTSRSTSVPRGNTGLSVAAGRSLTVELPQAGGSLAVAPSTANAADASDGRTQSGNAETSTHCPAEPQQPSARRAAAVSGEAPSTPLEEGAASADVSTDAASVSAIAGPLPPIEDSPGAGVIVEIPEDESLFEAAPFPPYLDGHPIHNGRVYERFLLELAEWVRGRLTQEMQLSITYSVRMHDAAYEYR
eukprot:GHVT01033214.1.p1 GENE.GHVT01033214.1~~GHVT01033214.1.p1  ORF type:complete len:373 (-),score=56.12 GHVT01033214.1:174-1292(-)